MDNGHVVDVYMLLYLMNRLYILQTQLHRLAGAPMAVGHI